LRNILWNEIVAADANNASPADAIKNIVQMSEDQST
jgi:hypothetical protein